MAAHVPENLRWALLGILGLLVASTLGVELLARRRPAWAARQPPLRRFTAATEVIRFFRLPAPTSAKNEALAALLALAREEPLAARVVLEALLPGLKAIAKPLLLEVEREQLWSLLLTGLWEQIVRYPAARPRRAVALYLLSNTRRAAVRTLARERRRAPQQLPLLPLAPAPPGPTSDIDGVLTCHEGVRYCRDSRWTSCLEIHSYALQGSEPGGARE